MKQELTQFLQVSGLLWLRCAPLFVLTPYLVAGAFLLVWGAVLSWAFAASLAPIAIAGCSAQAACAAALGGGQALSWHGAARELVVGLVVAVGFGMPGFALRTTGSIAQALAGSQAAASGGGQPGTLARAAGVVALVGAVSAGALSGVSQWLLALPLSAAGSSQPDALRPELFRSLSEQLVRAFGVGVSLGGPLLLGAVFAAIFAGLWGRIVGARRSSLGPLPLLLPWLGIALVSLCVANWLDSLPELVRAFAQSSARLLDGLP